MTHADIIARLTAATGPDRELDAEIDAALRFGKPNMEPWVWNNFPAWRAARAPGMCEVVHDNGHGGLVWDSQPFTASVDACLGLIERVLPGWTIAWIGQDDHKTWHAELRKGHATSYSTLALAGAPTPALACLLALFRALEAQETV